MKQRQAPRVRRRTTRKLGFGVFLATVLTITAGCVPNAKQDSLTPKGELADMIYRLVVPVFIVGGIVSLIVLIPTIWFSFRYRVREDDPDTDENIPVPVYGNTAVEVTWTVVPALVLLVIGIATVATIFNLDKAPPEDHPHIEVVGQQWWWEFRYDLGGEGTKKEDRQYNDIVTANDMVIPAGTKVSLKMTARDVIHGWWVPELQGKRDTVPGRTTYFYVDATDPGTYFGQCTVMCGLSHANMRFTVIALPQDEYDQWISEQVKPAEKPTGELAVEGESLFKSQCGMCHTVRGIIDAPPPEQSTLVAGAAPDLTHFMSRPTFASGMYDLRIDEPRCVEKGLYFAEDPSCINSAELRAWIHDPPAMLPMAAGEREQEANEIRGMPDMGVSPEGLDQLVAFLETLK